MHPSRSSKLIDFLVRKFFDRLTAPIVLLLRLLARCNAIFVSNEQYYSSTPNENHSSLLLICSKVVSVHVFSLGIVILLQCRRKLLFVVASTTSLFCLQRMMDTMASIIKWALHCDDETIHPSIGRTFNTVAEEEEFYTC